jgi:hypothetical protein
MRVDLALHLMAPSAIVRAKSARTICGTSFETPEKKTRNRLVHCITYVGSAAGAIFGSGKESKEERIRCDTGRLSDAAWAEKCSGPKG